MVLYVMLCAVMFCSNFYVFFCGLFVKSGDWDAIVLGVIVLVEALKNRVRCYRTSHMFRCRGLIAAPGPR